MPMLGALNVRPPFPAQSYLWPRETHPPVLEAMETALHEARIDEHKAPFLYRVALHHLAASVFSPPLAAGAGGAGRRRPGARRGGQPGSCAAG